MSKFSEWLIRKLGGIPKEEHEELRLIYEKWAMKHLTGKNGEVTPDCAHYFPFDGDDICILRSRVTITNSHITGIKIAPWCQQVVMSGLTFPPKP